MGRHRQFDVQTVLDAALSVFWRKGFEGASYEDLIEATGVKPTALYAAFGNKHALFRRALERYNEHYQSFYPAALALSTAREVVEQLLRASIDLNTRFPGQTGCFIINAALTGSDDAQPIRDALLNSRATGEAQLRQRFERAQVENDLPPGISADVLTRYVTALLHGLAVQAKAGHTREMLEEVVSHTLAIWPSVTK